MLCPNCGRKCRASTRFCRGCGTALARVEDVAAKRTPYGVRAPAERRQMTVLFCDLVDSVALSSRFDPEELMTIYDHYQTCCDATIRGHGGFPARYMGDGILAYFGYPRAGEADAENAIRAGIALLDEVQGLEHQARVRLRARIGIATGLVVLKRSRGEVRERGIVGDTPNLAARLQSIARPDSIIISDSTRQIARGLFTYRDLGAVPLKGFAEPATAWEVLCPSRGQSRFQARQQGGAAPFIGRRRELAVLLQCWGNARTGRGQVVFVSGEPGIGKSRLVETLQERLVDETHIRVRWYGSLHHTDSALHPIIEQIVHAANIEPNDPVPTKLDKLAHLIGEAETPDEDLAAFASLLSIPLGRPSPLDPLTPERRKQRTAGALLGQFFRVSQSAPVLAVVEDAHWLDATSLDLLDLAVEQIRNSRVLLIITHRPGFKPRWSGRAFVRSITLDRLDRDDAEQICAHVAGKALPLEVLRRIAERCDGVPLFAEELTKAVIESSTQAAAGTNVGAGLAASIPMSLHDSLVARLDRLGTAARDVANIAAAIGRSFPHELLAALAAKPGAELHSALRQLIRSGLVRRSGIPPAATYRFKHALIRDAAYESLLRADRQELHSRIAAVLSAQFPHLPDSEPELLAYHLSESGASVQAIPYWERAGLRSASRASHVEAAGHYGAALRLLRSLPDTAERDQQELQLSLRLALSQSSSLGYAAPEVRAVLTRARELCDRLGNVAELFPVLRGLCTFHIVSSDLTNAEELGRLCLRIGEQTGRPEYRIEGDTPLGYILFSRGAFRQAQFHLERAIRTYDEHRGRELVFPTEQDPRVACASLVALSMYLQGDLAGAERASRDALSLARSLSRPFDLAYALCFAALYECVRGRFARAKRCAEEAIEPCQRHGFGVWLYCARLNLGNAIGHLGDPNAAVEMLESTLAAWSRAGCRFMTSIHIGNLAKHLAAVGRFDEALSTIAAAIAQAHECGDVSFLSALHYIRAEIIASAPQPDLAAVDAELDEALSIARAQGAETFEAEVRKRLRDPARPLAGERPDRRDNQATILSG
jgi:class 3 adenylate cyclase/tetratricopeptide (TPR) repeat protein